MNYSKLCLNIYKAIILNAHVHRVFDVYHKLGPTERKIYLRKNWLKFLGGWGAAELIWGIWGA